MLDRAHAAARGRRTCRPGTASRTSCTASTFDVHAGRGGDAARPQRRRQDHDAEIDHGHRRPAHRLGALRGPRADRRSPRTRSRAPASPSARRSAASSRASTSRRTCCCRRVVRPGGLSLDAIFELFPNLKERLGSSQGTKLSGGEQQMLAIAPHPAHRRAAAAARRADRGAGAGHHPADRQDHPHAEAAGLHHPAGRAELPLRRDRRRPLLRDGARPGRRPASPMPNWTPISTSCTTISESEQAPARRATTGGMAMKRLVSLTAAGRRAGARRRRRPQQTRRRQDRRAERHVEPLRRHRRRRARSPPPSWRSRTSAPRPTGHQGRAGRRRPSEQAGRRLQRRQPVVSTSTRST